MEEKSKVESTVILIKNAYEHNLKNISTAIPHNKTTVVSGVSGSGKSTLIYDILATEALRREKIDSDNATCLNYAIRPKFERITNLPYCVSLKQRGLSQSISSTLATITGLHELLRGEFAKYGDIKTINGNNISAPTSLEIKQFVKKYYPKVIFKCYAVICMKKHTDGSFEIEHLKSKGCMDAIFISSYDEVKRKKKISTVKNLNANYEHTIIVPIDDIKSIELYENIALESFLLESKDVVFNFGVDYFDLSTGIVYQKKSSELLSFNSPALTSGRCTICNGHGIADDIDVKALFNKKSLAKLFLNLEVNNKGCYKYLLLCKDTIQKTLKNEAIDSKKTYFELSKPARHIINELVFPRILKHRGKPSIGKYIRSVTCPTCKGTRLNYKANAVKLFGVSISEILNYSVDDLYNFFSEKNIHHKKILVILSALKNATLGYLSLDRTTDTLSGGELQRLKFALELNSRFKDLLYIFDEPSSGLHPYNNHQMMALINDLKNKDNTVLISEHNPVYINNSDYHIELGPGSGIEGGEIVYDGPARTVLSNDCFTRLQNRISKDTLELNDVTANNIHNESFTIPLYSLVCISGVSGSGKSSLVHKVLVPCIKQYLSDKTFNSNLAKNIVGIDQIKSIVELTQSQIGLNTRSIVATYLNIFGNIRDFYANLEISKEFGFDKSFFSFNSESGYCPSCKGLGVLDDVTCPSCLGSRYKPEVIEINYKNKNIVDILNSPISELSTLFENKKLSLAFDTLTKLGLSHLTLGRTTPTLSGGEAQRLKLAKVLIESFDKVSMGGILFVLDEPTTGLSSKNINEIVSILDEIISLKNSVIVIEHNLDIIRHCDYVIDIGVGSGDEGGKNIFSGTPAELLKNEESLTAKALNGKFQAPINTQHDGSDLKTKKYNEQPQSDCNSFYLNDEHFLIEKVFSENYTVITDSDRCLYFRAKDDLIAFVNNLQEPNFSFNPFVSELYKYKIVPNSARSKKIKHLEKLGHDIKALGSSDNWHFRVPVNDIEQAYNYGNGWVTVTTKDGDKYELATRLVSITNQIIGSPYINEAVFNLYLNSCSYCKGTGYMAAYDKSLIIKNKLLSINDAGFLYPNVKLKLKGIINKFKKEGLFDFSKPYNDLTDYEKHIFLFGFKEYKFLKPKGRQNAIGDYIRWQGLYTYIFYDLNNIEATLSDDIRESKHDHICPFCTKGFSNEVNYYIDNNLTIVDIIEKVVN